MIHRNATVKLALSNILGLIHATMCQGKNYELELDELRKMFVSDFKPEEVIQCMHRVDSYGQYRGIIAICSMLKAYSTWEDEDIAKEMDKHNVAVKFREHRVDGLKRFLQGFESDYWTPVLKTAAALNELRCFQEWIKSGDLMFTCETEKNLYESRHES